MLFFIKKMITAFIAPPGSVVLLLILMGLLFRKKLGKRASNLLFVFAALLLLLSMPAVGGLLVAPLENFPVLKEEVKSDHGTSVIIVMGGGLRQGVPEIPGVRGDTEIGLDSLSRLNTGFLVHKKSGSPIIVTGGSFIPDKLIPAAEVMADTLRGWEVPEKKIIIEPRARTSRENASFSMDLLPKGTKRIYLVTSAYHMKRSLLSFRKELEKRGGGPEIIPIAANYNNTETLTAYSFLPNSYMLYIIMAACHEYLGMLFYNLQG